MSGTSFRVRKAPLVSSVRFGIVTLAQPGVSATKWRWEPIGLVKAVPLRLLGLLFFKGVLSPLKSPIHRSLSTTIPARSISARAANLVHIWC